VHTDATEGGKVKDECAIGVRKRSARENEPREKGHSLHPGTGLEVLEVARPG